MTNSEYSQLGSAVHDLILDYAPEDIFDEATLEKWAKDNGFVKEDEIEARE